MTKEDERTTVSWFHCIEAGAIGGIGAIPGTLAAHPYDVVKVRQQVNSEPLLRAVTAVYYSCNSNNIKVQSGKHYMSSSSSRSIKNNNSSSRTSMVKRLLYRSSSVNSSKNGGGNIRNFLSGSIPAVQQKIVTRTPMFLVSALSVSIFENKLHFDPTSAAFIGSAASGYVTGSLASPWEWQKVLLSQKIKSSATGKGFIYGIVPVSIQSHGYKHGLLHVWKRIHSAGIRNAIFDSTFFGTKRIVEDQLASKNYQSTHPYLGTSFSYGFAALIAVIVDYSVDVYVKRLYALRPEESPLVPSLTTGGRRGGGVIRSVLAILHKEGLSVYKGLSVKCVEFGVSYVITGLMAAYVSWTVHELAKNTMNFLEQQEQEEKAS